MNQTLQKEFDFFERNKEEFSKKYNGEYIGIKDEKVIVHNINENEVIRQMEERYKLGTFIVQSTSLNPKIIQRIFF